MPSALDVQELPNAIPPWKITNEGQSRNVDSETTKKKKPLLLLLLLSAVLTILGGFVFWLYLSQFLNSVPDSLVYSPKSSWNVVEAKDGSSKFDFPESFKLSVTSVDDKVECKPETEEEKRRRKSLKVGDFVTSISVYGFSLNGQSLKAAVDNPKKTRLNGEVLYFGGNQEPATTAGTEMQKKREQELMSSGNPAIYQLHKWTVGKPFGPLYRHRIYIQKGNNFVVLTMFVTEPFNTNHKEEILGVLSSLR